MTKEDAGDLRVYYHVWGPDDGLWPRKMCFVHAAAESAAKPYIVRVQAVITSKSDSKYYECEECEKIKKDPACLGNSRKIFPGGPAI